MLRRKRSRSDTDDALSSSRVTNGSVYLASSSALPSPAASSGNAPGAPPRQCTKNAMAAALQVLKWAAGIPRRAASSGAHGWRKS
jgi:hypothetical protein